MLLNTLYTLGTVQYLLSFLQTVITAKRLAKSKVATLLVNYKVILF